MSNYSSHDYDDPAHDADMRALRREQLEADITPEEAEEECRWLEQDDDSYEDDYQDKPWSED